MLFEKQLINSIKSRLKQKEGASGKQYQLAQNEKAVIFVAKQDGGLAALGSSLNPLLIKTYGYHHPGKQKVQ